MQQMAQALDDFNPRQALPTAKFDEFVNWDSVANISIVVMINLEYQVEISGIELRSCSTPQQLFDLIVQKQKSKS